MEERESGIKWHHYIGDNIIVLKIVTFKMFADFFENDYLLKILVIEFSLKEDFVFLL